MAVLRNPGQKYLLIHTPLRAQIDMATTARVERSGPHTRKTLDVSPRLSHMILYAATSELVTDDYDLNGEDLVVRDIDSGDEKARVGTLLIPRSANPPKPV